MAGVKKTSGQAGSVESGIAEKCRFLGSRPKISIRGKKSYTFGLAAMKLQGFNAPYGARLALVAQWLPSSRIRALNSACRVLLVFAMMVACYS
jgi:hypothetical protein